MLCYIDVLILSVVDKYENEDTGIFYVKLSRDSYKLVLPALPMVTEVGREKAILSCIYTAATLKRANIYLIVSL